MAAGGFGQKNFEELRMTRSEMLKLLKHPLFTEIVSGFYVRVACSNGTCRMSKVVTTTQLKKTYQI